jgi:hypothetical protein
VAGQPLAQDAAHAFEQGLLALGVQQHLVDSYDGACRAMG